MPGSVARSFLGGGMHKNTDQIINVGMIGHASSEDTRILRGDQGHTPPENVKFEVLKLLEMH